MKGVENGPFFKKNIGRVYSFLNFVDLINYIYPIVKNVIAINQSEFKKLNLLLFSMTEFSHTLTLHEDIKNTTIVVTASTLSGY